MANKLIFYKTKGTRSLVTLINVAGANKHIHKFELHKSDREFVSYCNT